VIEIFVPLFFFLFFLFFFRFENSTMSGRIRLLCPDQSPFVGHGAEPAQKFSILVFFFKSAFLFTLFATFGWSKTSMTIMASVAFTINKCSNYITILTGSGLAIFLNVLLAFFTNAGRAAFAFLLELISTIRAFHNRERPTTFFAELLTLRQFFKWMATKAFATCKEHCFRGI